MKYEILNNKIIIYNKEDFNIKQILECGQVFCFKEDKGCYYVYSADKMAKVMECDFGYEILTDSVEYFINYFDLQTDYSVLKNNFLKQHKNLKNAIEFGGGIRILKQDIFETIIGFIISANNNIKRIQKIMFAIREKFGEKKQDYFSFPTLKQLSVATEQDFKHLGAGYRAKYLVNVCKQLKDIDINNLKKLNTKDLNAELLKLMGVGQKVADCIMLFAFSKGDVFPVDTWIEKVFCDYFYVEKDRKIIRKKLIETFGENSGYIQQYLFYAKRETTK